MIIQNADLFDGYEYRGKVNIAINADTIAAISSNDSSMTVRTTRQPNDYSNGISRSHIIQSVAFMILILTILTWIGIYCVVKGIDDMSTNPLLSIFAIIIGILILIPMSIFTCFACCSIILTCGEISRGRSAVVHPTFEELAVNTVSVV